MARTQAKTAQEILMEDFQTLVSDTERLLDHTATLAGDQADELRSQIHETLLRARDSDQPVMSAAFPLHQPVSQMRPSLPIASGCDVGQHWPSRSVLRLRSLPPRNTYRPIPGSPSASLPAWAF